MASFGSSDPAQQEENRFYDAIHAYFDLPSRYDLKNRKYSHLMNITWDIFSRKIIFFKIKGNQVYLNYFMRNRPENVFNIIDRNVRTSKGYRFAYDMSKLHEGILSGRQVIEGDKKLIESDERRAILDLIDATMHTRNLNIPQLNISMGSTWKNHGVPDAINVKFDSMAPHTQHEIERFVAAVAHRYGINSSTTGLNGQYIYDRVSELTLTFVEHVEEPAQPVYDPQQGYQAEQAPQSHYARQQAPEMPQDTFPYDYYASIGVIDAEGMVLIPTILGPMRVEARSEAGREHLMNYTVD